MGEALHPRVIIEGDVVRRPAAAWTSTVHSLLRHLRASGVPGIPEPLAIDEGEERLRLVPGASGADCWAPQATEQGLRSAARLLRTVHDAARTWIPPTEACWALPPVADADCTICHGDPGPWNMVWNGGAAVGLIDWDQAHPAPAMDDVAYALEYLAPFRSDEHAIRWQGFTDPPDRQRRIAVFAQAYGLDSPTGLVDAVIARQRRTIAHVRHLADQGVQPQRDWVAAGHLAELATRVRWSESHRSLLEPAQP